MHHFFVFALEIHRTHINFGLYIDQFIWFLVWKCIRITDFLVWKCLFFACFVWILENKLYLCGMFLMHLISESYLSI